MTKIQIYTRLDEGVYKSLGGGETRLVAEYSYGPRNLVKAYRHLLREQRENLRLYGNIGCGRSWLTTTDGRALNTFLAYLDDGASHAEQVRTIELALLTTDQRKAMEEAADRAAAISGRAV